MACLGITDPYDATKYLGVIRADLQQALDQEDPTLVLPNYCNLNSSISWLFAALEVTQAQLTLLTGSSGDYPVHFFDDNEPMGFFDGLQPMGAQDF